MHEQAARIASNSGGTLSIGFVAGILVSLWSAMGGAKAMIDALNVIYEQKEGRNLIKLNLVALVFTLAGFAAFLLAMAVIVVLPLVLSPIGLGSLTETLTRLARWPVLLVVLLIGLAVLFIATAPIAARRAGSGSPSAACSRHDHMDRRVVPFSWYLTSFSQLQCHLWLARSRGWPDDLVVVFGDRGFARCRAQRGNRASDRARFDHRCREAARRPRGSYGRYRRRETGLAPPFRVCRNQAPSSSIDC